MKLTEAAGNGSFQADILKDSLFSWSADRHPSFPAKVTFQYVLPTHYYAHRQSGERHRLPPTYDAHLSGLPGFTVEISYAIVVNLERIRDKSNLWQKSARRVGSSGSGVRRIPADKT